MPDCWPSFFVFSSSNAPPDLQWKVSGGDKMTDREKKQVAILRDRGLTYQQIVEETGIGLSTVKMYFKRQKAPVDNVVLCAQCKKPLPKNAPMRKRFCSDKCRIKWWLEHPDQLGNAQKHLYHCPVCHKAFYAYKPAKFCSSSCYHQSRRKAGETNA